MPEEDKESLLARGYTLPAKKPKGPRPTVSGVRRRKKKHKRGFEKPKIRLRPKLSADHYVSPAFPRGFPSIDNIVIMLKSPAQDVILQGMKTIADISRDPSPGARNIIKSITKEQYKQLMKYLRRLAERSPSEKVSFLAYQALDRFRWARHEAGMLRMAKDPLPKQWIFRDGTILPFLPPPPGRHMQRRNHG